MSLVTGPPTLHIVSLAYWMKVRYETHMINSNPIVIAFAEIGDTFTIPEGHAGSADRPPGQWAKLLWDAPYKVARRGQRLKGQLPELLKNPAVRELMARVPLFYVWQTQG
jgi:hypothetical protein